jgi:NAD(P)-dependent dehydrogenase (short-subunit alcohol dehydrogenase family)
VPLEGKVAVVTGAAGAIGSATCRRLVARGASVVLVDRDAEGLTALAGELGASALAKPADVTREDDVRASVVLAVERWGRLDILHNNAAAADPADGDVLSTPDTAWRSMFDLVVMAAVWGCRHAIPHMVRGGGGAIVNTSSGAAQTPTGTHIAYGSMKGALETLSAYVASHHGSDGVRSNVVAPAFVLTAGTRAFMPPGRIAAMEEAAVAGRLATADDIADVVVYLASDEAAYVSGQVFAVNGGGRKGTRW